MIQDIAPHTFCNEYHPQQPTAESWALAYRGNGVFVVGNGKGALEIPTFGCFEEAGSAAEGARYLFSIDDEPYFLVDAIADNAQAGKPDALELMPIRTALDAQPRHLAFAAITGFQLSNWYRTRAYCGACGSALLHDASTRSLICPACGQVEYPKISPSVIVGITDGDRLLLARYPNFARHALIAGFVEIGETLEETVRREVKEEVGVDVKDISYYKSQPWSLSDSLLMGFFCTLDGSDEIRIDETELASAAWFDRKDVPIEGGRDSASLTADMVAHFKEGFVS